MAGMPNGNPGDNPITDLLLHGFHPFPPDVEDMVRRLHAIAPQAVLDLGLQPFDWQVGRNLEEGRQVLKELLERRGG